MRIKGEATNPDDIEFTISLTASLKEWTELRSQLKGEWPSSRLNSAIVDVLLQARRQFDPKDAP